MENEIREQKRQHLEAVGKEQDQVKELLRRGKIRHYFLVLRICGPEKASVLLWAESSLFSLEASFFRGSFYIRIPA